MLNSIRCMLPSRPGTSPAPADDYSSFNVGASPDAAHARHKDELPRRWHCGDRHLDQRRSIAALEGALERCPQLLWRSRTFGLGAEALRIAHEIGIGEIARDQPVAELLLLDPPHIAESAIVEHDDGQRDPMVHGGGKLVRRDEKAAVARDREDRAVV